MAWRWDQGRNQFFVFSNIQRIAQVVVHVDGASLAAREPDPLRIPLERDTDLVFKPRTYKVWRNHGRIFACCMLAAKIDERLTVTDLCRGLSSTGEEKLDMDRYLSVVIPRFAYPYPAFDDYDAEAPQVFPFCACLKLLLHGSPRRVDSSIGVDEVAGKIVGNGLVGSEPADRYEGLPDTGYRFVGDEKRQVREMLAFLSQSSFLKWSSRRLYLDIIPGDAESIAALTSLTDPEQGVRETDPDREIIRLGSEPRTEYQRVVEVTRSLPADVVFTEGKPIRVTHLRTERSPYIRSRLFAGLPQPYRCDVCGKDMQAIYPWTDNILEVHHLLPLSAAIDIGSTDTSLSDVVPTCPNCHRSVHIYYKQYLNTENKSDFASKDESREVYSAARAEVLI